MKTVNLVILCVAGIALLYGYNRGILGMAKTFISLVGARILYPVLYQVFNCWGIKDALTEVIQKYLLSLSPEVLRQTELGIKNIARLAISIAETISGIIAFVLVYFAAKAILSMVYRVLTPKIRIIKVADKICGMVVAIMVVVLLGKFSYDVSAHLAASGWQAAANYKEQIDESRVATMYTQYTLFKEGAGGNEDFKE